MYLYILKVRMLVEGQEKRSKDKLVEFFWASYHSSVECSHGKEYGSPWVRWINWRNEMRKNVDRVFQSDFKRYGFLMSPWGTHIWSALDSWLDLMLISDWRRVYLEHGCSSDWVKYALLLTCFTKSLWQPIIVRGHFSSSDKRELV